MVLHLAESYKVYLEGIKLNGNIMADMTADDLPRT
jgi:hypothetical protein